MTWVCISLGLSLWCIYSKGPLEWASTFQWYLHSILLLLTFLLFSVSFSCDGQIQFLGCFRQVREANDGRKFIIDFLRFPNNLCTITSFLPIFYLAQICHCSFFISLFPGFGFLPCFSWWAQCCLPWSSVHLCFPWRARIPDSFWHPDPSSFPFYLLTVFSHLFRYDFQAVWQLLLPATS